MLDFSSLLKQKKSSFSFQQIQTITGIMRYNWLITETAAPWLGQWR